MGLEDEIGVSVGFRRTGTYTLVTEAVAVQERALVDMRREQGAKTDKLTAAGMGDCLPVVDGDKLAFGVYGEADGSINTPTIMRG
jgi:glycine/D-amino acid oxidase-like deaminating enzyme